MRIHVANPNATRRMTETIARAPRAVAGPDVEIVATTNITGPDSIEGPVDGARAAPGLLDLIAETHADAHVIACFDDTGLDAARALTHRPVVVTSAPISVPVIEGNLIRTGLMARCAEVWAAGVAVLEIGGHGAGDDPVAAAIRSIGLDGVVAEQPRYAARGFRATHRTVRHAGRAAAGLAEAGSRAATAADMDAILVLDRAATGFARDGFLRRG